MKKIFKLLVICMSFVFAFTGCGKEKQSGENFAEEKIYKIATDTTYAPFEFENDKGELVGIDMELLKEIAADQGFKYEVNVVGFAAALTALKQGKQTELLQECQSLNHVKKNMICLHHILTQVLLLV